MLKKKIKEPNFLRGHKCTRTKIVRINTEVSTFLFLGGLVAFLISVSPPLFLSACIIIFLKVG